MIRVMMPALLLAAMPATAGTVTFDWALVGNPGNAGELSGSDARGFGPNAIVGGVDYVYRISKTEVTNAQYTEFLNAVAAIDNFGGADPTLYDTDSYLELDNHARGGITRTGTPGSYSYATKANMADKPVTHVSFIDAMRFTNWLHNGQGSGDTETGVYTIGNGLDEVRSNDAKYWIPSEDEWHKAAYHDASAGTAGVYFDYATGSDSVPTVATASNIGDISNPGVGVVNYGDGARWNSESGIVTTVGSAGIASASPYGTFDQNGNVWEWTEAIHRSLRGLRGGSFINTSNLLKADARVFVYGPTHEEYGLGFRVATVPVPESSTVLMGALAAGGLLMQKRG